MSYEVTTPVFAGPLELLLQLITSRRVEITEVSLSDLVGEYLAYLGWTRFLSAQRDESAQKEAVKALRKAAKLAPDSEKPYLFLGQLLKATGRHEPAERMFVKAVQVKSDCVEALRELRLINLRREKQKGLVRRLLRR